MEKKYDLRTLIQRAYDNIPCDSKYEKAAVTARIFDVGDEVNLSELGAYRKADIVSLIESALETKEKRALAKADNLEGIVQDKKQIEKQKELSKGAIVYGLIKDYAISIPKIPRYALFGALPAKIQEKLGKKYGENPLNYTTANIAAESIANAGLIAYFASTINFSNPIPGAFAMFAMYSGFSLLIRSFIRYDNKETNGIWLIRGLYESIGYTLSAFKKRYIEKKEELTKNLELKQKESAKLEQKKTHAFPYNHLEALGFEKIKPYIPEKIESSETKQLPPPERKANVNWPFVEELLERKASDDYKK